MIESGWAAFFPIYPSLPKKDDFNMAIKAAEDAWENQKGIWERKWTGETVNESSIFKDKKYRYAL